MHLDYGAEEYDDVYFGKQASTMGRNPFTKLGSVSQTTFIFIPAVVR